MFEFVNKENIIAKRSHYQPFGTMCQFLVYNLRWLKWIFLLLVYCTKMDRVIDNTYIFYQNDYCNNELTRQPLQVNVDDHIVNGCVFRCDNGTVFIMIVIVAVNAIYYIDK